MLSPFCERSGSVDWEERGFGWELDGDPSMLSNAFAVLEAVLDTSGLAKGFAAEGEAKGDDVVENGVGEVGGVNAKELFEDFPNPANVCGV